ncbi:MAG: ComF family protein [Deltaproteobacteria bacterium]|nr:ComF family protein [Deltaproteobacteria bacterium]
MKTWKRYFSWTVLYDIGRMPFRLLDLLFPPQCRLCGALLTHGSPPTVCQDCRILVSRLAAPQCLRCGHPVQDSSGESHPCGECLLDSPPFEKARSMGRYEGLLLRAIHRFKFSGDRSVGELLGDLMALNHYESFNIDDYSLIIPVPLHPRRLRQRGFNQSLVLARRIAKRFSVPIDSHILLKREDRIPQTGLTRAHRKRNVRNLYTLRKRTSLRGLKVLLIDDVYTTGATVKECSRMLLKAEAAEVGVLTAARTL